jgi:hypothetical protein
MYFGYVICEQSNATSHMGQILLGVSHTQLDSAHTSALLTAQHITHSISFCPDIPSVSPYTFLGLYTCTVGTSFREIYCDKRHLLWFACSNQYFTCPTRIFILAHQHKALFFLREIPQFKLIVLSSIWSFEV